MICIIDNKICHFDELPENYSTDRITDHIDEEEFFYYNQDLTSFTVRDGKFVPLKPLKVLQAQLIRKEREKECFPIINRGALWYNKLSEEQKQELSEWYEAWLDAPATGTAPTAPIWLNEVAGQAKTI